MPLLSKWRMWYLFLFLSIFSKFNFLKISILWHIGLLDMFLHRSPKTALKNTQNSPLYSILKLIFPKIFKNESFHFSQYSRNFIFKKFPFYSTLGFLTCSSIDPRKLHLKTPRTHLSTVFWNWPTQKFSKMKVFIFLNILKIFFPTYA